MDHSLYDRYNNLLIFINTDMAVGLLSDYVKQSSREEGIRAIKDFLVFRTDYGPVKYGEGGETISGLSKITEQRVRELEAFVELLQK